MKFERKGSATIFASALLVVALSGSFYIQSVAVPHANDIDHTKCKSSTTSTTLSDAANAPVSSEVTIEIGSCTASTVTNTVTSTSTQTGPTVTVTTTVFTTSVKDDGFSSVVAAHPFWNVTLPSGQVLPCRTWASSFGNATFTSLYPQGLGGQPTALRHCKVSFTP